MVQSYSLSKPILMGEFKPFIAGTSTTSDLLIFPPLSWAPDFWFSPTCGLYIPLPFLPPSLAPCSPGTSWRQSWGLGLPPSSTWQPRALHDPSLTTRCSQDLHSGAGLTPGQIWGAGACVQQWCLVLPGPHASPSSLSEVEVGWRAEKTPLLAAQPVLPCPLLYSGVPQELREATTSR